MSAALQPEPELHQPTQVGQAPGLRRPLRPPADATTKRTQAHPPAATPTAAATKRTQAHTPAATPTTATTKRTQAHPPAATPTTATTKRTQAHTPAATPTTATTKRTQAHTPTATSTTAATKRTQHPLENTHPPLRLQPVLAYTAAHLDQPIPLSNLAREANLSPFHLHRIFASTVGESPKQYALRLRLARAAVLLLTTRHPILDIALDCGFQSHEVFTRAFRRRFGLTPLAYRRRGFATPADAAQAATHARIVASAGPCLSLYYLTTHSNRSLMSYEITKKDLDPQPVLIVRKRVPRTSIAATIGESLGLVFQYAQQHGIAVAGLPFTRYPQIGAGMVTMEPGMRVASPGAPRTATDSPVLEETLPGGPAATTIHAGSYDTLHEAYAAIEVWIESQGWKPSGAPWECYLTDPSEHPDPKDWKTQVFWPVETAAGPG